MRRSVLAASGSALLLLAAAVGNAGPPPRAGAGAALGGFRVVWVDALFLRADALRREGRFDEVRSIYAQILDLEPDSEDAVDFLASTEARDLRMTAPTDADRVRWWRAAMDLVTGGLRANPGSARLHWRAADLLVSVADSDPAVADALAAVGLDREAEALRHLLVAARLTDSIPRLSFLHLLDFARLAPRVAAERLASGGGGIDEALAAGSEVLRLRGDVLDWFPLELEDTRPARDRLQAGLNLVARVGEWLRAKPPRKAEAKGLLADYVGLFGKDRTSRALAPLLE